MINLCYLWDRLTPSQRLSLITLQCKNREFHYLLNYWRPISLLNVDYKIVSKTLSLRLRKVLLYIIHGDQTCSVIGRSITDNVHLLRNIFNFVEQKGIRCAFVNLDQAKAFDRVSTEYLLEVLQAFGYNCIRYQQCYNCKRSHRGEFSSVQECQTGLCHIAIVVCPVNGAFCK